MSGRALSDIQGRVGIPNLIYAGNHLEILGVGLHFVEPIATERRHDLLWLSDRLSVGLRHIPGVEVEYKGLTATVHFRRAPVQQVAHISRIVRAAMEGRNSLFVVSAGKESLEIRPRVNWHKGRAVRWVQAKLRHRRTLSIYFGDDITDEDAFAVLSDGITVKVGEGAETAAQYFVPGPEHVTEFLEWLADHVICHAVEEHV